MKTVLKILAALAAIAGAVYVIATYGDKIVAWAKKLVASCPCHRCGDVVIEKEAEAPAEESAGEPAEQPAEEPAAPEAPADPEIPENEPVAEENDFEG